MAVPVVLFVYNRLDHTTRVIETLSRNLMANETDLFVFSDAAKNEQGIEKVKAVRDFINAQEWQSNFKSVTIVQADKNKGLANSVISGVSSVLQQYKKVIVVEDDLILAPYFLKYMNEALEFYEKDEDIWSISGYTFPMKCLEEYAHDVYYSYRGCSWGWGTWLDRWEKVDWQVQDYSKMMKDKKWIKHFNRGGNDLANMLTLQMEHKIDSWAIRWCFAQSNLNMYTVYPRISYLENEGCDGTGTHSGESSEFHTSFANSILNCKFEKLKIEKKISKEFYLKHSDTLNKKIKRNLKKIFGEK